ncbi:MAG: S-adenosylmethionine:tRNA ribosyltransferase-isomerase [Candidatus Binatia bacterium]
MSVSTRVSNPAEASTAPSEATPVSEFDYELPSGQIARQPAEPRGASRLMVLERSRGDWTHTEFARPPNQLHAAPGR